MPEKKTTLKLRDWVLKHYGITQERLQEYVGAIISNCPKACLHVQHTTHLYGVLVVFHSAFFFLNLPLIKHSFQPRNLRTQSF